MIREDVLVKVRRGNEGADEKREEHPGAAYGTHQTFRRPCMYNFSLLESSSDKPLNINSVR